MNFRDIFDVIIKLYPEITENSLIGPEQISLEFNAFVDEVIDYNQHTNLTRLTSGIDMALKNIWDSLAVLPLLSLVKNEFKPKPKLLDIGSGAGFPALPLAICESQVDYYPLDSAGKRCRFLEEAAARLKAIRTEAELGKSQVETLVAGEKIFAPAAFPKVRVIKARAEEIAREKQYREQFELITARAVSDLPVLLEYAAPLVKNKGFFIAMKAKDAEDELKRSAKALKLLNIELVEKCTYNLPLFNDVRSIMLFQKQAACPKKYPRHGGTIKKRPLG